MTGTIRGRARESWCPRPELGALIGGREYDVPAALFDDDIFDRVEIPTTDAEGGDDGGSIGG